jgi:hypothetical protein
MIWMQRRLTTLPKPTILTFNKDRHKHWNEEMKEKGDGEISTMLL